MTESKLLENSWIRVCINGYKFICINGYTVWMLILWCCSCLSVELSFLKLYSYVQVREGEQGDVETRRIVRYPDSHQLFVGNLPHDVDKSELKDFFQSKLVVLLLRLWGCSHWCGQQNILMYDPRTWLFSCRLWQCCWTAHQQWWKAPQFWVCGVWWSRTSSEDP